MLRLNILKFLLAMALVAAFGMQGADARTLQEILSSREDL